MLVDQIGALQHRIDALDREIRQRAREDSVASRLMTVPGIGPICASAMSLVYRHHGFWCPWTVAQRCGV
jgi:transposase